MTRLWQTSGRNTVDFDEWMRMDPEYVDRWSLGFDLRILLATIPVVLLGTGAR
jgi:lipopolysaccharide/colanic/teichoic acid biosynthesis glycosyltransferase